MDNPCVPTGYGSTCRLTARELSKKGHTIYAMAFNGGPNVGNAGESVFEFNGIKIISNYARQKDPDNLYGDVETFKKIEKEIQPDVYFWHNDSYRYSYMENLPQGILDKSVFWLPYEGNFPDPLGSKVFGKCAAVRFVTNHALQMNFETVKNMDYGIIPHAVDMTHLVPCPNKDEAKNAKNLGIKNKFVVARVDRHQPRKHWATTLKSFAKFAQGKEDVFLLCKCNPQDCTMWDEKKKEGVDLRRLAEDLGIKDKIFFDDFFFDNSYLPRAFYWPADVFLTTTSGEGFGLTPVEAMACGIPVVYPDTPVLPEVIGDIAGFQCKLSGKEYYNNLNVWHNVVDIDDVAAKLQLCYDDWKGPKTLLSQKGEASRKKAFDKYDPEKVYSAWEDVIQDVGNKKNKVSIITVLYNIDGESQLTGEDGIDKLRNTIEQYVSHPYEWLIVDNNSPHRESTRKWIQDAAAKNPKIKPILLDTNMGFAGAHNIAIEKSVSKYVVLVNPDSEAINPAKHGGTKDFIQILFERMEKDKKLGIVGMRLMERDDVMSGMVFPYFCCCIMSRECLDAIKINGKYFDENFWPAYYEDAEVVFRAMSKGFKISEQNVPFWHKSGGTNKHAIEGGKEGKFPKILLGELERIQQNKILNFDYERKRGEILASGMQGVIGGNIAYLNQKWGISARKKIKVIWHTHIGAAVGFSQIAEGLCPELEKAGFDVYINDWSHSGNVEDPVIKKIIDKTEKAKQEGWDFSDGINIVCWLMETFLDIDVRYKIGISLCESTKVRESYLHICNRMDRILTFSEFCKGVQLDSGFKVPINVVPPGVNEIFMRPVDRSKHPADKFSFLTVGVFQGRKDIDRLVSAFCEAFPKDRDTPPECEQNFPLKCNQVELVIKSNNFGDLDWIKKNGFDKRANIRAIFTGWASKQKGGQGDFSTEEMAKLYADADCVVHPSHGEGIGMPILEGAASGLPVIFTNWSSPSEYFDESNSYPCSLSPYPGTTFSSAYPGTPGDNGVWANIHIGHMKHLMYEVIRERAKSLTKGAEAAKHVKENYTFKESARIMTPLLFEWERERQAKLVKETDGFFDPVTFKKPALEPVKRGDRIMIDCVTRDRHPYLASMLTSLLMQSFKDWDILIEIDDSDESVLVSPLIMPLMYRIQHEGHGWRLIRSHQQGPHIAHDRTLQMVHADTNVKHKLICRIDDDIFVRPDYLEKLYGEFLKDEKCELGAVAGVYLDPKRSEKDQMAPPDFTTNINYAGKIEPNVPWPYICPYPTGTKPREMEHLYSSFLYRTEVGHAIGGYCKLFSQLGHREESDFSYRFHLAGYKLLLHPEAIGFHFQAPSGGIRSDGIKEKERLASTDHKIYQQRLETWHKKIRIQSEKANQRTVSVSTEGKETVSLSKPSVNIVAVVNSINNNADEINKAIEYFSQFVTEVYVTTTLEDKDLIKGPKLAMVANTQDEMLNLTRMLLSEGKHDYVMTVSESMRFQGNLLNVVAAGHGKYEDFVFEVYKTYISGRWTGEFFISDESLGTTIGPELRNQCLISSKSRKEMKPDLSKICYSDIMVIDENMLPPVNGKSVMGNDLLPLSEVNKRIWRKICTYQFPQGKLEKPQYIDINPVQEDMVSIIIPTNGRRDLLKKCINTIFTNSRTPFEIIIIDNNSKDGTLEMLEKEEMSLPRGKAISVLKMPTNLGYQKAVNIGVSKAKGKYILLYNDDAWVEGPEPDGRCWLKVMIDELNSSPKVGIVGPHAGVSPALQKEMLFFWCVMFRRNLYDEIGPLDDVTFFNYGGDDDYIERIRKNGYEMRVKHLNLRHLMTCVPDEVKKPELEESRIKLIQKYQGK